MNTSSAIASKWTHFTEINPAVRFIDVTLRGCAQVMFQNNPLTGLIFFIAIFIAAYGEGNPAAAYGCVLGTVVATFTGMFVNDRTSWLAGLYGYNGCLVGVALPTFLSVTPQLWGCIITGSIVSVIATVSIADILKTWKVAALTAPFVLTTWVVLLASYAFSGLDASGLSVPELPHPLVSAPVGGCSTATYLPRYCTVFLRCIYSAAWPRGDYLLWVWRWRHVGRRYLPSAVRCSRY